MSPAVQAWWLFLIGASAVNVAAWLGAARVVRLRAPRMLPEAHAARLRLLGLALVYVLGCGFRSVFPRADVQRIVIVDSWLSSVTLGRCVATVAELCFAIQWALWLRELGRDSRSRVTSVIAALLVPLIVFAEISSWFAVISSSFIGNAIEQSTWASCGVLITVALWPLRNHEDPRQRTFIRAAMGICIAFVTFMVNVDVPMYWGRWREQQAAGHELLSFAEGLHAATHVWVVTHAYVDWQDEMTWMALYFSLGVLISIAFSLAPAAGDRVPSESADRKGGRVVAP